MWWYKDDDKDEEDMHWRQVMLENTMQCQGLEDLWMIRPGSEMAERWKPKIREWREKIATLSEPPKTWVGVWDTHEYPDLWGDLWMCSGGFVLDALLDD